MSVPRVCFLEQTVFQDYGGFNACQPLIKSLELETEAMVVDAKKVQHRRVQVTYMNRILNDCIA